MNISKKQIGTVLQYIIAISLIVSGTLKLIGVAPYVNMIQELSPEYYNNIYLLGGIAIIAGFLFIIPRTFTIGAIASFVFLGGTISAHMQHGDNYLPQLIFVLLAGLAVLLKRPAWFSSQK
ncbi:MAG: hypothetical protein ACI8ZM_003888 [Crocinitomix sp.]|jgi:hypothetical protein